MRKLTETCQDNNLRLELRMIRQSPLKLTSNYTKGCSARDRTQKLQPAPPQPKHKNTMKKEGKNNTKVLELLKAGLRKEEKSKSKPRRC